VTPTAAKPQPETKPQPAGGELLLREIQLVFPSVRGGRLSRDAIESRLTKYSHLAVQSCPSLKRKKVTPHACRHSVAMDLLDHGVDRSVIALWLGHESPGTTQMYLHADMRLKEKALSRTAPLGVQPARYRPHDKLLAFLFLP